MGTREEGQHDHGPPDCTTEDCHSRACGSRAFPQVPKLQGFDDDANEAPHSTAQGVHPEAPEAGEGRGGNCDRGDIRDVDGLGQFQGQCDNSDALACAEREDRDTDS
jgi:hypothetical protein